jgi:type IV pilus biogenesis protein PilP
MTKNIFSVAIMVVVMAGSFAVASDDIYRNAEKIESKTFLIQKEREYQQALTQLEALKRQAEKDRIQQDVELMELRKKHREISGSSGDPKVLAIMGAESSLEAVLSFSDGSAKTFRTGDILPGGGKIAGITESEVLVTKGGKKLVTLAYETPKSESTMEFSVYQPDAAMMGGAGAPPQLQNGAQLPEAPPLSITDDNPNTSTN